MMLPVIGSVYQSVQMMKLNMKWQQRKANPTMQKEDEDPQVAMLRKQAEDARKSSALSSIRGKLLSGQTLTSDELEYLKNNDPQLYQDALELHREREAYKKQLENCKTQEEVDRLHMSRLQNFVSQAKTISNNPNIPQGQKKALLEKVMSQAMGIQAEKQAFVQAGRYARLPSEREMREEEQERAAQQKQAQEEAREAEREEDASAQERAAQDAADAPKGTPAAPADPGDGPAIPPEQQDAGQAAAAAEAQLDTLHRLLDAAVPDAAARPRAAVGAATAKSYTPKGPTPDDELLRRARGRRVSAKA